MNASVSDRRRENAYRHGPRRGDAVEAVEQPERELPSLLAFEVVGDKAEGCEDKDALSIGHRRGRR
jgi:hypothetical protein